MEVHLLGNAIKLAEGGLDFRKVTVIGQGLSKSLLRGINIWSVVARKRMIDRYVRHQIPLRRLWRSNLASRAES